MENRDAMWKFPELKIFLDEVHGIRQDILNAHRPPEQVLLDEVDFQEFLKISKRTAAGYREKGLITYYKVGGKIYYKLSDVLAFVEKYSVPAIDSRLKIK